MAIWSWRWTRLSTARSWKSTASFSRTIQTIWPASLQFVEDDPHVAERYRRHATQRILEEYTWDHITDQYEDYFRRLVAGEKPALDRKLGMYVPTKGVDAAAGSDESHRNPFYTSGYFLFRVFTTHKQDR